MVSFRELDKRFNFVRSKSAPISLGMEMQDLPRRTYKENSVSGAVKVQLKKEFYQLKLSSVEEGSDMWRT